MQNAKDDVCSKTDVDHQKGIADDKDKDTKTDEGLLLDGRTEKKGYQKGIDEKHDHQRVVASIKDEDDTKNEDKENPAAMKLYLFSFSCLRK